jgi:uncharacterized membrane protein HdeD (DUF308 family)
MAMELEKWWSYLLLGIIGLLFGILALVWPGATTLVLIVLFGCYALVEGLFALGYSISRASKGEKFFALMMLGLLGVLVGIITLARPGITTLALVWVIAFWALIRGIMLIVSAFEMSGTAGMRWLIGLLGVCAVIIGILFFFAPFAGVFSIILLIGLYSIAAGIILIIVSFIARKAEKEGTVTSMTAPA